MWGFVIIALLASVIYIWDSSVQTKIPVYIENGYDHTWFSSHDTKSYKCVAFIDRDVDTVVEEIIVKLDQEIKQLPEIQKVINDPTWNMSVGMKKSILGIDNTFPFFTMDWKTKKFDYAHVLKSEKINIYIRGFHSEFGDINPFDKDQEITQRRLEFYNKHAIAKERIQDTLARL